jgi:hypothetical protein
LKKRGKLHLLVPALLLAATLSSAQGAAAEDARAKARVPEARDYQLVYALDIPVTASFHASGIPYTVDASASFGLAFDRIAYYLELESADGRVDWAYVSMQAFTADAAVVGLPTLQSGRIFQQAVSDLHVASNVAGIEAGDFASGGNVEIWPFNYAPANVSQMPGASDELYDWGDAPTTNGGYGSLQVHHHSAGQTILAYNRWGEAGGSPSDIGIGNAVDPAAPGGAHPDWTFRSNAGDWTARRLEILLRPGPTPLDLRMLEPQPHAVFQRDAGGFAHLPVRAEGLGEGLRLEARALPLQGQRGNATDWLSIPAGANSGSFAGEIRLEAGWYALELRAWQDGTGESLYRVEPVGVGEVLVIAGQSNSANHGQPALVPTDPRVSAFDGQSWRLAADPQPIATGAGGSPWPALGDILAEALDLPIGFVSVGWGGTRVDQWLPEGALYPRIADALAGLAPNGARALLWHQGESDAAQGTSAADYAQRMDRIIQASRGEPAAADLPWGIALVSFLPGGDAARRAAIIEGQRAVIEAGPMVFEGPDTDPWIGEEYRWDGIHFNERGLRTHAAGWATAIAEQFSDLAAIPTLQASSTPAPSLTPEPSPSPPSSNPSATDSPTPEAMHRLYLPRLVLTP